MKETKETKSDRFIRVVEARTNKAIKMIRLIGNCSDKKVYEYTPNQFELVFKALQRELVDAKAKYLTAKENKGRFSLSNPFCEENIPSKKVIYTHDEAAQIVDIMEESLTEYNICVPSPEDDEREPDDMIGLYGSTYDTLLNDVENNVIDFVDRIRSKEKETDSDEFIKEYTKIILSIFQDLLVRNRITVPPESSGSFGIFGNDRHTIELYLDVTLRALRAKALVCEEVIIDTFSGTC